MPEPHKPPMTLETLARHWQERDDAAWRADPARYVEFGRSAITLGNPALAYDILKVGLVDFPADIEIAHYACLALARSGATRLASSAVSELLARIPDTHGLYVDTLSLAARLAKDQAGLAVDDDARHLAASKSAALYRAAYEASGEFFPGINAASMSVLAGKSDDAVVLADRVLTTCRALQQKGGEDHWLAATMGEACLLLGRTDEASEWYERARVAAHARYGDIAAMRRQLVLLSAVLEDAASLLGVVHLPTVVAFAGHMIDVPGRPTPRFPGAIEGAVSAAIADRLGRLNAGIGYTSAACGADILFAETLLERGGEVHILLPFAREDFVETSVAFAGETWAERFEHVLARATSVRYATRERYLGDDCLFAYTSDLVTGAALLRAKQLTVEPVLLAVMEKDQPTATGGTMDTVVRWKGMGNRLEMVDLGTVRDNAIVAPQAAAPSSAKRASRPNPGRLGRVIQTMLFADIVGFSKLREEETPSFVVGFLGHVADMIAGHDPKPSFCNTWGDGLFIVFDDVRAGARFALALNDSVIQRDWRAIGFPDNVSVRIGMHAGPVFGASDPILGRTNYFGSHVNRAARIEPVTPPGTVYVSEQVACLLATTGDDELVCDYLGATELAKQFGSDALYRLRRLREVA